MDKASLLGDAIAYINELQSKLHDAELHIKDLQIRATTNGDKLQESPTSGSTKDGLQLTADRNGSSPVFGKSFGDKKFSTAVNILGDEAMIRVDCVHDTHSIVNLMMALQELHLEIRHSNTSTTKDNMSHVVIAKVFMQTRPL